MHRFDLPTQDTLLVEAAPGTVPPPAVHTRQISYSSVDGTTVRMFIVAGAPEPDRPRPALLTGYGGFAVSNAPYYSALALTWVAAGGVWALASLRGGGEEGEDWHRAGMREHKQNVFDDFHAASSHLVSAGWTTPEQLAILGGSNGGLLSYSPYHHVRAGVEYPAVLFTVFESDSRVDPNHARKMCAALQHATSAEPAKRPVLLRRETDVGHGARSVSRTVAPAVDEVAFLAAHTGQTLD